MAAQLLRMSNALPTTIDAVPASSTVWPGVWYPLGATYDGAGCNFSVFSEVAERPWMFVGMPPIA
jgi:hypothetical protein